MEMTKRVPALTEHEERALRDYVATNDGNVDRLDADERAELLYLLDKAGCRRWWGLRLRDPRI